MRVSSHRASASLDSLVRSVRTVETDAEAARLLLPDTGVVLGFRYRGASHQLDDGREHRVPDFAFTGVRQTVRHMRTSPGGGVVLVVLREGAGAWLFSEPLHALFGLTVPLDELVAADELELLGERLLTAPTERERVDAVEAFLLAQRRPARPDPLVDAAVRAIFAVRGSLRIGRLARDLEISRDRLEKRFRARVGSTPKQLATLVRFRYAVALHQRGADLTRLSHEAGFFDQAHFNRTFRSVTGTSPNRFFGTTEHC